MDRPRLECSSCVGLARDRRAIQLRAKLKGVTRLPVTIALTVSSPVRQTMNKQVTLRPKITKRVIFQTSNIGGNATIPGGRG